MERDIVEKLFDLIEILSWEEAEVIRQAAEEILSLRSRVVVLEGLP